MGERQRAEHAALVEQRAHRIRCFGPEIEQPPMRVAFQERTHDLASGHSDADLYADAAGRVMELYRRRLEGHVTGENSMRARRINLIERKLRLAAIGAERDTLFSLVRAKRISDDTSRALVRELDLLEERLR